MIHTDTVDTVTVEGKENNTVISSIACLVALPLSLGFAWTIWKILMKGNDYLNVMMNQYDILDFKEDIEDRKIFDLESAFLAAALKGAYARRGGSSITMNRQIQNTTVSFHY